MHECPYCRYRFETEKDLHRHLDEGQGCPEMGNAFVTLTEYVVYCETHRNYLKFVSSTGTSWCDDQAEAKRYSTKPAAAGAAKKATWLDHRPIVWAVAATQAEL